GTTYYFGKNILGDVVEILLNGNVIAKYWYNAWGEVLKVTDPQGNVISGDTHVANVNPFRYRGYYYDTESGFYYLNSRYYDPVVKRFINADGQLNMDSLQGVNMYAYCEGNPVGYVDGSGGKPVPFEYFGPSNYDYGSVRKDIKDAPDIEDVEETGPTTFNCYGNALQKAIIAHPSEFMAGDSTEELFAAVCQDLGKNNVRRLNSINDPIGYDEYMVAVKGGWADYHFIVLLEEGWYNKSGGKRQGLYVDESFVTANFWIATYMENGVAMQEDMYYFYETIYFAVKIGWDKR
ncbi:MAG: RHS repeat-associated core domain-containing protein, partial [Firmicutes bacterium]|nr:RHS repeat-associated core domain-containing protein [Bacillota bacterium]